MKAALTSLALFLSVLGGGYSLQEPIKWKNGDDNSTFTIDFNKEEDIINIELELTEVGTSKFESIKFESSDPSIDKQYTITENIIDNKIKIGIKSYLIKNDQLWEKISDSDKETQITITISRENKESMKFIYKTTPKKPTQDTPKSKEFTPIPFPIFSYSFDITELNKKHRILLIDGTPRNNFNRGISLKKADLKDTTKSKLVDAKALVTGRSLSVFTKNISLRDLEYIKISVSGNDYIFNAGVSDLFDLTKALGTEAATDPAKIKPVSTPKQEKDEKDLNNREYFTSILEELTKVNEMTIEDYQILQKFQAILLDSVKGKRLNADSYDMISQIAFYTPKYLNITSFPLAIPNHDEVEISSEIKYKGGQPNSHSSGTFRTAGALSVNVGSALYLTGLKNNNVYTEPLEVEGQPDELWAVIDEKDQLSVGVGVNSEVTYRTGSIFRPSINLGFFIPFDEEITPFFAIGPGLSIIDKKVSLSFSYGFAFGKINSINERYRDIDLNDISNFSEANLIQKVWSRDWYFSIGLGFNISSSDD